MAKSSQVGTVIIVIIIIALALFLKNLGTFSILPSGQYNTYGNCIFNTNVDPIDITYSAYGISQAWIAINSGSGQKEKFGYAGSILGTTTRLSECSNTLLVENFNQYGDDIYSQTDNIYVCVSDGKQAKRFLINHGAASNAITACLAQNNTCTSNQDCYDRFQSCYYSCVTNQCHSIVTKSPLTYPNCSQTCESADTNCDGIISTIELINYASLWLSGQINTGDLITAANLWRSQWKKN